MAVLLWAPDPDEAGGCDISVMKTFYPHTMQGFDKLNRPILWEMDGKINAQAIATMTTKEGTGDAPGERRKGARREGAAAAAASAVRGVAGAPAPAPGAELGAATARRLGRRVSCDSRGAEAAAALGAGRRCVSASSLGWGVGARVGVIGKPTEEAGDDESDASALSGAGGEERGSSVHAPRRAAAAATGGVSAGVGAAALATAASRIARLSVRCVAPPAASPAAAEVFSAAAAAGSPRAAVRGRAAAPTPRA